MALWGKTDTLASTPKFVARKAFFDASSASVVIAASDRINLIPSNTGFSTGDAVVYSINGGTAIAGLTDGTTYYVRVVAAGQIELYSTQARALDTGATTGRVDITDVGAGVQTLQRTGAANALDHNWNGKAIVFVDDDEARTTTNRAKGIKNAGWWLYSTYTDSNSVTRHKASCLVALKSGATAAGDREDTIAADLAITIGTHPQNASVTAPAPATFTVAATVNSTQVSLAYQWQIQQEGAGSWADISGATSSSYTTGATATGDGAGATDGDKYRVVITAGDTTATSNTATLTVA